MIQKLLHTPEGVRDIYNDECEKKLVLEKNLREVLRSYGYRDIETPTFEYFDVFGSDIGTIPSRELYKFFDREGSTMVLRPDFTPSIARAASKYFADDERAIRLCYMGNTFINNSSYQGRLKESTQMGAELIGDSSADADAEIIAMVVQTLLQAGLKDFQISVGHVQFFNSLVAQAGLEEATVQELKTLIRNKNVFGAEKLLSGLEIDPALKELLAGLPNMFGREDILDRAASMTDCEGALDAIERLRKVLEILRVYELDRFVSFDLGMTSSYMYYTGIIFRGYTYGTGDAIVKGGRYDDLLAHFGKDAPSIGFVVVVNQLMNAMMRQKIEILPEGGRSLIIYREAERDEAIRKAMQFRRQGHKVELELISDGETVLSDADYRAKGGYAAVIRMGDL